MQKRLVTFVAGLALALAGSAFAQTPPTTTAPTQSRPAGADTTTPPSVEGASRSRRAPRSAPSQRSSRRAAPAPSPEQVKAAATALAAELQPGCQVVDAVLHGSSAQGQALYEATCATGPGYILISAAPAKGQTAAIPATSADCVDLIGQAEVARQRDPNAAPSGVQCKLPGNQDVVKVISAYAQAAGVTCTVDQAAATGARNGHTVYEAGCPGTDGYWVEREGASWTATPCIQIRSANGTCRFTTAEEEAATLKGWLAGSAGAACDVTGVRYMGANANGAFYEAKCAAGDGLIARLDAQKAVQQVYPCAEAARIGGGCKLTEVPAAAAPPASEK